MERRQPRSRQTKQHSRLLSSDTVIPEDFRALRDNANMASDTFAPAPMTDPLGVGTFSVDEGRQIDSPSSTFEKPLPVPPQESQVSQDVPRPSVESSNWRAAALPFGQPDALPVPTTSPVVATPRQKMKIPWKSGKNILMLLPVDDERGQPGKAPRPMTQREVENMQKDWQQLGYNTKGFNIGPTDSFTDEIRGQSRTSWPDQETMNQDRLMRQFKVSIPDRKKWDDYVQELKEAKLRALGVSFGDDDPPPTISPVPSSMSRSNTMQYPPLPFSPPIPTSSGSSSHATQHQNPFSPTLMGNAGQSTSQSSMVGSIASPASMHAHMYGKYNPRASISFSNGDHPFGSPFQYPQQSSPGVWSPVYQPSLHRGGSPSISHLGSMMSPASPFPQDSYFPRGDAAAQMQQRQHHIQSQLQQQAHFQGLGVSPSPRLQEMPEDDDETIRKSPSKTPEPSAAQQRLNASESLQKEIDDAEYHLEEQFQRQLEHDDYSPHSEKGESNSQPIPAVLSHSRVSSLINGGPGDSRFAATENSGSPVLHHPQPHSRGHSLSQRAFEVEDDIPPMPGMGKFKADLSDIDTGASGLNTPDLESKDGHSKSFSNSTNPWQSDATTASKQAGPKRPGHAVKPSMSKLNVAAPEFKFNPANTIKSSQFSYDAPAFKPSTTVESSFTPLMNVNTNFSKPSGHQKPLTFGSISKINVDAPAFTPGNSDFNFSSSGPTFRPDAPAFTPAKSNFSDSIGSGQSGDDSSNPRQSIFGKIDMSLLGFAKQPKKSKAIPIIRPDSSLKTEKTGGEAEEDTIIGPDGRITQGEGRAKRIRNSERDGDSIPLFAEPTLPLQETSREQSPPKEATPVIVDQAEKENAPEPSETKPTVPIIKAISENRPQSNLDNSPDYDGKSWAPWEHQQEKEVLDFSSASAFPVRGPGSFHSSTKSIDEKSAQPSPALPAESVTTTRHKKNSLSALAKPFEFGASWFRGSGSASVNTAENDDTPLSPIVPAPKKTQGLGASRYATSTPPPEIVDPIISPRSVEQRSLPALPVQREASPISPQSEPREEEGGEPTFEEIDAVMRHMNETDSRRAINREVTPQWHEPSPARKIQLPNVNESSPIRLPPQDIFRSDAPSPSPGRFQALPQSPDHRIFSREQEDPFSVNNVGMAFDSPVHRLNTANNQSPSDWDDVLSESEEAKFHARAQFFDNHVNELVGGIIAQKLDPMERVLEAIQHTVASMGNRAPSNRRTQRSVSGELPDSEADADDEDDDQDMRRSLSPRRDRKMEKIRSIITEALAAHQPPSSSVQQNAVAQDSTRVMQVLEEMREQFGQSMRLDLRGEDLRNIVEEAVERRMPASPKNLDEEATTLVSKIKIVELEAKVAEYEARAVDMSLRLKLADEKTEEEIKNRRAAEDRLAEVQRLLRISSEEEDRLRESVDEKDHKLKALSEANSLATMHATMLEANAENTQKSHSDIFAKLTTVETEFRQASQQAQHWQAEAERVSESAKRHSEEAERTKTDNSSLRNALEKCKLQIEENLYVRESMRIKLTALQDGMALAEHEVSLENATRFKKEQELIARQEVLDARLEAEARTRERLEREIERLEGGEREGWRAVNDAKRLELQLTDLRDELNEAQKTVMRYHRESEDARESGMIEVQRIRNMMQADIDLANSQVNNVRQDLEDQVARLRGELDHVRLDADTATARFDMLLEEATESKQKEVDEHVRRHANEMEDMQTRHERQLGNTIEDAARSEQLLLERLSLSAAKTEHLQDRVTHLEEKLEIARAAALAAAQSARSVVPSKPIALNLPERISPQALRESIMVLQEQLQERESNIESLEAQLATVDLDAPNKISKRDDEITWLRELLAVRNGDLQDIITTVSQDNFDAMAVKDAAIRLKANLQMEMQERERAMNGGSSISASLPNLAASFKDAASSPRVAQVVGPMAAAWGNWRKSQTQNSAGRKITDLSGAASNTSTPSRQSPGGQSFLSGLLTPPTTSAKMSPLGVDEDDRQHTGRRYSAQGPRGARASPRQSPRSVRGAGARAVRKELGVASGSLPPPRTPPMLRKANYDQDADDFGEGEFFDEDDETIMGERN